MEVMNGSNGTGKSSHEYSPKRKRAKTPPGQISPLLINHVLEQIFTSASLPDLKNFRLVCREWNNSATKCLQDRSDFITIGCRNTSHVHSLHYQSGLPQQVITPQMHLSHLDRFLQIISSSKNPPFTKFEFNSSFFTPENQQVIHKFLSKSSPFMQVLKISLNNRSPGHFDTDFLTNIIYPKLRTVIFEVLRQFTLEEEEAVNNSSEFRDNAVSYRILSNISFGATSLENLELSLQRKCTGEERAQDFERDRKAGLDSGGSCPCQQFNPYNTVPSWLNMFPTSSKSPSSISPGSGSTVAIGCHLPLPIPSGYQAQPLRISNSPKLKRLHLRLRNSFIHQKCLNSLLQRLANTLEELCISEEGHGSRVVLEFPIMKRLSRLTFSSTCEFEQNFVTILPFSYREQLPRLTSLNLWECFGTEKRYEQLFLSLSPSHLTKLVFPTQFKCIPLAQNVPQIFPNLKSLTMVFSNRTESVSIIETVFQLLGESLEELYLITDMYILNQSVDHVLTGLPKEICRKMRMEENFILPLYLQGMERKASLINLKRLKRLVFQLEHKYSRAPLITDVTGYLGFMEMESLEYLRFTRYGMSWSCCEALRKKLSVDILCPNGNNVFEIETFDFDFEGI